MEETREPVEYRDGAWYKVLTDERDVRLLASEAALYAPSTTLSVLREMMAKYREVKKATRDFDVKALGLQYTLVRTLTTPLERSLDRLAADLREHLRLDTLS